MFDYRQAYDEYWSLPDRWGASSFDDPDFIINQILATCGNGRLLDAGCGMGLLVRKLLSRGVDAYGVDIAAAPVEEANRHTFGRFKQGSILDIPYGDGSFEILCSLDCLEHLAEEDVPKAVSEIYRVTDRYAFIRVSTFEDRDKKWHLAIHDRSWWEKKFLEAGFRKHTLFFEAVSYEELEREAGAITLVFEKVPPAALRKYPMEALLKERDLHMDMNRESGRRSEAHCLRYYLACYYVRPNDTVLDAACGLGYGSAILWDSTSASRVIGLDESAFAADYASENYSPGRPGLEIKRRDICDLSDIGSGSINLAVSFETLEHLKDPEKFLQEVFRVLVPGGRFFCSVPNLWIDETGKDPNPHHHHVFDLKSLKALCGKFFILDELFAQTAGGGLKCKGGERSILKACLEDERSASETEWWLLACMKDPVKGSKGDYVETTVPDLTGRGLNVVSFSRDYENPWIVSPLVYAGWRIKNPDELKGLISKVLNSSAPDSPDRGAALCVLAYRFLEQEDLSGLNREWIVQNLQEYIKTAEDYIEKGIQQGDYNPHTLRWAISNRYVLANIYQNAGDFDSALEEYWRCANMDFTLFSPLLATKTVDAAFRAGWLYLGRKDSDMAAKAWRLGVESARRAVQGDWGEIIGCIEKPFDFGLREATQVLDLATKCSNGLAHLDKFADRPGKFSSYMFTLYADKGLNRSEVQELKKMIGDILNSSSWKITAPLRKWFALISRLLKVSGLKR